VTYARSSLRPAPAERFALSLHDALPISNWAVGSPVDGGHVHCYLVVFDYHPRSVCAQSGRRRSHAESRVSLSVGSRSSCAKRCDHDGGRIGLCCRLRQTDSGATGLRNQPIAQLLSPAGYRNAVATLLFLIASVEDHAFFFTTQIHPIIEVFKK